MALFSTPEEKEAKKEAKLNEMMAKYGLENLSPEYREAVKKISLELMGTGMMETGMTLSFNTKTEDQLKVYYLRTIMEQNWMIIRLLDEIKRK